MKCEFCGKYSERGMAFCSDRCKKKAEDPNRRIKNYRKSYELWKIQEKENYEKKLELGKLTFEKNMAFLRKQRRGLR